MDGNKWQELNSSTTRIGQSSQVRPTQQAAGAAAGRGAGSGGPGADEPTGRDGEKAGGLPAAAKAGLVLGAIALVAIGGLVAFGGGDDPQSPDALALTESADDTDADADADGATAGDLAGDDLSDGDLTDAADAATVDDAVGESTDAEPASVDEDTPDEAADAEPTDAEPTDAEPASPIGADSPPSPPGAPVTHSILANGKIYLRGTVPSEAIEGLIVAAVSEVLGEGNVVSEYVVDPSIPFDPNRSAPVYIADTVLFAPGSAEIAPDFYPLLGLGVSLIQIQPTVSIEIVGHTDAQGSDQDNLVLSQQRVDAVRTWMVAQGADGDRLVAVGKGETEPRADNSTPEGRQSNRRVEFIISGFEFG